MDEKTIEKNEEIEINLQRVVDAILKKNWLIILAAVICSMATLLGSVLLIAPKYESSAMFYVNNNSISVGDVSLSSITSSDITASKNLVNSYIVILQTRESLEDVIDYAGVNRDYEELKKMITAKSVNDTEIFEVIVTSEDPQEAESIADAIAYILPKRISSIIEGTSAKVVDSAVLPVKHSSPSYTKNTLLGFVFGMLFMAAVIALREVFDVTIRTDEDVAQTCRWPVLAAVPDMTAVTKGGYEYAYDRRKTKTAAAGKKPVLIGSGMSFAAAESYKLLRTKLQFSFAGESGCRVIGISSAMSGEGKSLSAINLAFSMSQLGKRVILIDCDMRRPTLAEKLGIQRKSGLSSYLTGQCPLEQIVQYCGLQGDEQPIHVVAAGQNPPNPIELLSSEKMTEAISGLRTRYDYIILDLPPVSEVSDALAVAKETDGILLVVRQNYCNRIVLGDTIKQFDFVGAKILGVVYNCITETGTRYGKGYYRKYNRNYSKKTDNRKDEKHR